MMVHVPAQRPAVHVDGGWCTWMYETRNETDQPPSGSTIARGRAGWNHVLVAHRRMRDPQFRQEQEDGLRAPHVAPINDLVDELIEPPPPDGRGWIPYVAPVYGGVNARVLCIQRDPGPMTNSKGRGSGFLCPENDDATAERFATLLDNAGIAVSTILAWNAYPWYINRKPQAAELEAGVEPLRRLLALLPQLQVVMLHGGSAQDGWRRLTRRHPDAAIRLEVVPTYHTSSQAFIGPPEIREARKAALTEAFAHAARILKSRELGPSRAAD
jgi:Uracil DNA glycosylase superfamily